MNNKKKITLEYPINCTTISLYRFISTEAGLRSWFADDVKLHQPNITFFWNKTAHPATIILQKENNFIRMQWLEDAQQEYYFEMRIVRQELTGDVALIVTDFVTDDESSDAINMWDNNLKKLRKQVGAYQ